MDKTIDGLCPSVSRRALIFVVKCSKICSGFVAFAIINVGLSPTPPVMLSRYSPTRRPGAPDHKRSSNAGNKSQVIGSTNTVKIGIFIAKQNRLQRRKNTKAQTSKEDDVVSIMLRTGSSSRRSNHGNKNAKHRPLLQSLPAFIY